MIDEPLNVLLVEDSEDDAALLDLELRHGGLKVTTKRVETEEELGRALDAGRYELALVDYALPNLSGGEAVRLISAASPDTSIIVVSGKIGEEAAVEAMKSGAGDYIMKDRLSRLIPVIERELDDAEARRARRKAEEENRLLNRLLQTILEIDKMMVRETDSATLLDQTCRILVEHGGFRVAWVGMVEEESNLIRPEAWAGFEAGYVEDLKERLDDSPLGRGPSGTSVRSGRHSIFHDVTSDEDFIPWRDAATSRGYRSCAAFPIRVHGRVVGNINVYSSETNTFGEKMVDLLDDLAGNIGYALQALAEAEELRRAEQALRESGERFRQLFEQNEDALLLIDSDTFGLIDANPTALSMFGYSGDELSKDIHSFLKPEDSRVVKDALVSRGGFTGRLEAVRKDGSSLVITARAGNIRLRNRDVIFCTMRDITDVARMEEESKTIQAKLIQANKMTSLGTLASGVAHEINNPNNFIMFNSTLLKDAWEDAVEVMDSYYGENGDFLLGGLPFTEMKEVMPDLLTGIADGSRRIKNIIDNLSDFSRTDTSGLDEEFDVNDAVKLATEILTNQIGRHTDNFRLSYTPELPRVKGSAQKIEQVVINLVMNALQALPSSDRSVAVTTSLDPGGREVLIKVSDEGPGIPSELVERVIEPFFTTKGESGGTGLGLSISYNIVREHGGSLEFDSGAEGGTVATVRLPAAGG